MPSQSRAGSVARPSFKESGAAVAYDVYPGTKHNGALVCSLYLLEKMESKIKLLRFGVLTRQILTAPNQIASIEAELSKFDTLALENGTVCLDKLECSKRATTRKKVCVHGSS